MITYITWDVSTRIILSDYDYNSQRFSQSTETTAKILAVLVA